MKILPCRQCGSRQFAVRENSDALCSNCSNVMIIEENPHYTRENIRELVSVLQTATISDLAKTTIKNLVYCLDLESESVMTVKPDRGLSLLAKDIGIKPAAKKLQQRSGAPLLDCYNATRKGMKWLEQEDCE